MKKKIDATHKEFCEDDFQMIAGDAKEVIIDGIKYKKVTNIITSWRKIV